MPFEIVRNDIVNMQVDAIVNTANPRPVIGSGTDSAIHAKAGPALLEARKAIGSIKTGDAAITPAFGLNASYVIHTVGPVWRGGLLGERQRLRSCYDRSLRLAWEQGCKSIAFPMICAGNYGFPKDQVLQIAISAFGEFLMDHEMQIYLVVFDRDSFRLSEKLFQGVSSFIDEHYVETKRTEEYSGTFLRNGDRARQTAECLEEAPAWEDGGSLLEPCETLCEADSFSEASDLGWSEMPAPAMAVSSKVCQAEKQAPAPVPDLTDLLAKTDAGFSETLLKLIDRTGKKDSAIYKKANVSKQHFSKIRNNPHYQPTKATAVAFAIALELDLEQTRDLIGRAGYALTNSSKFDVIIMYFIRSRNYNMFDINSALFEYDQTLLGA